jgi:glutaredoxin
LAGHPVGEAIRLGRVSPVELVEGPAIAGRQAAVQLEIVGGVLDGHGIRILAAVTSVVLYARDGCHLCDEARRVIEDIRRTAPFDFTEIDIETDDALIREYGIRIPVVAIDGEERFEISVDPAAFRAAVEA